jgi:hypothetical protein
MPPPGWYDDPEQPWTWRYWDGARWTEHRAPMWVPPDRDPTSLSAWIDCSVAAAKVAVRGVGLLLAALWMVVGVAGWGLVVAVLDSDRWHELRELLGNDRLLIGPTGSTAGAELTDAEADRAWELTQEIVWSALPWIVALVVAVVVSTAWSVALVARAVRSQVVASPGADQPAVRLRRVAAGAIGRVPAVIGSGIAVFAVHAAIWAVGALALLAVALIGGGAAAIVLAAIFVVPMAFLATVWCLARLALASVIAAAGGHGIGVRRSWDLTRDRFWFVLGRLLMTAVVAGVAGVAINAVNGLGQFLGSNVFLAIASVLQALAFAASIVVTTCGLLAAADQLVADRHP